MGAFENTLLKKTHDELVEMLRESTLIRIKLEHAILWALGEEDEFPPQPKDLGTFYWREELRSRSGMVWNRILGRSVFEPKVEDAEVVEPDLVVINSGHSDGEYKIVGEKPEGWVGPEEYTEPVSYEDEDDEPESSGGSGAGGGLYGGW